jgi:3-oxoacyl-[acyl-carrier protein] reductase
VTGGTGGLGTAICEALAAEGCCPVVGYRARPEEAQSLAARWHGQAVRLDLEKPQTLAAAAAALADLPLDGVILNASPPLNLAPWMAVTPDMMTRQWLVAVEGNRILLGEIITRCFRPRRAGRVLGVLSEAISGRMPQMMPYAVAKAGLAALLDCLAGEIKWLKVRTLSPGFIDTPMLNAFEPRLVELLREQGKIVAPREVAGSIVRMLAEL